MSEPKKPKKPTPAISVVVNVNNNKVEAGRKGGKAAARRRRLRKQINDNPPLGHTDAQDTQPLPKDVNLNNLVHFPPWCPASGNIAARWCHEPGIRFSRRTKVRPSETDYMRDEQTLYRDSLIFNDEAYRRLGLKNGMKLAIFVDSVYRPKYLLIQNVQRHYAAPMHIAKLGQYVLTNLVPNDRDHTHVCVPGSKTERGCLGHAKYKKYPMSFMETFSHLNDHFVRLYRVEGTPDLLIADLRHTERIPSDYVAKLTRKGRLIESIDRPLVPDDDVMQIRDRLLQPAAN